MATGTARYIPELADEYQVAETRPADLVFDFRDPTNELLPTGTEPDNDGAFTLKELLAPNSIAKCEGFEDAFVIPDVLSPQECLELIETAEQVGIVPPSLESGTHRTAKRTSKYQNTALSNKITSSKIGQKILQSRLRQQQVEESSSSSSSNNKEESGCSTSESNNTNKDNQQEKYCGEFYGIHSNWRIVRYDCCCDSDIDSQQSGPGDVGGDAFPAHQDQMDSIQIKNSTTGVKDFYVSTHTLLISLSSPTHSFSGGATRFYPNAKVASKTPNQNYNFAIDVLLPQGWALVFPQLGLVHAGQPVVEGSNRNGNTGSSSSSNSKYVAQAGVLRKLPPGRTIRPSLFRLGPGLAPSASVSS